MILIVDDHEDIRRVATYMLQYDGYEVYGVESGPEALAFLESRLPHCIILDYHMPDMVGTEVLRHIRNDSRLMNVRVIMFSADPNVRQMSLEAGADAYVEKTSLDWDKLSKLVKQHCGPVRSPTDDVAAGERTQRGVG
jgi:CheY-like chemotaxis protein